MNGEGHSVGSFLHMFTTVRSATLCTLVEKKSINFRTAIIAPPCKHARGCSRDIFSSACKHCSATSKYSMAINLWQRTAIASCLTRNADACGNTSHR
uniref:Uncharacterized protein MANES_08G003000 n=1 Tax=Rhizophora mucronata TaxID=61149 RepID=A0A2P2M443_RHIMU